AGLHVHRVVFLFRTARAGGGPWPVVRVVQPTALGVEQVRCLVDVQQSLPIGRRIAAVNRTREVETGIAARNVIAVEVGDVAVGVGVDGVVGGVRLQLHGLQVALIVVRLGAAVGLLQSLDVFLHDAEGHPLAVSFARYGSVVGEVDGELLFGHAGGGLI